MKIYYTFLSIVFTIRLCSAQFQYVSPVPGSVNLPVKHNIILREGNMLDASSIDTSLFTITGSESGSIPFHLVLCDDEKTINLNPLENFDYLETVTVSIGNGAFMLQGGQAVSAYSFSFNTSDQFSLSERFIVENADSILASQEAALWPVPPPIPPDTRNVSSLFTLNVNNNAAPGSIFFDVRPIVGQLVVSPQHAINIITNSGDSVFQRVFPVNPYDFQLGGNGYFSTYRAEYAHFEVMDSNFHVIDTYAVTNGFDADPHELKMLANGYAFLTGVEDQPVPGTDNQVFRGSIIQEFDPHHNLVFEWRSVDHVAEEEAQHMNGLSALLDYVHTNSIELDTDGNIIVSNRNIDQVNKIDVNTGEFIWRLGGLKNEFTFVNDTGMFSCQHDCRRLPDGNITLYDDGNYHVPPRSFAKEYKLDEVNKTATLVWSYTHPDVNGAIAFYNAMGSVQRLPGGNTFIDWGQRSKSFLPSVTEVDPQGNIVWEMTLDPVKQYIAYRAHKYEWNPCARPFGGSMQATLIANNTAKLVWEATANATQQYEVQYRKKGEVEWTERKINSDACYADLVGLEPSTEYEWRLQSWCDTVQGLNSNYTEPVDFLTKGDPLISKFGTKIMVYPNPASQTIIITSPDDIMQVEVVNFLGQMVMNLVYNEDEARPFVYLPIDELTPGYYFIGVMTSEQNESVKILVER